MRRRQSKLPPNQVVGGDSFFKPKVQPKLAMGRPGDKYEVEADRMADQVVNKTGKGDAVQKMEGEEEVQQKPLAASITPLVQKMETAEQEAPIQKMEEEEPVQAMEEEEEPVQAMEEEEPVQAMEEEEPVQAMEEEEPVQAMEEEEVQTKKANTPSTNSNIEGKLRNGSGGSKMDPNTKSEMESGFGADFSNVNIHNDSEAAQMSQNIGAQAFTHGNDVYFNDGKYNPGSKEGKHLLAHELTHTIQQKGSKEIINKKTAPAGHEGHTGANNKKIYLPTGVVPELYSETKKVNLAGHPDVKITVTKGTVRAFNITQGKSTARYVAFYKIADGSFLGYRTSNTSKNYSFPKALESSGTVSKPSWGETQGLYPTTGGSNIKGKYNPKNWNHAMSNELLKCRAAIHKVSKRNSKVKNDSPDMKNNIEKTLSRWHLTENFPAVDPQVLDDASVKYFYLSNKSDAKHTALNESTHDVTMVKKYGPFYNNGGGDVPAGPTYVLFYKAVLKK